MKNTIHNKGLALLQQAERVEHAQADLITEASLQGLPEAVQRYLTYAQVVGKEPIRTVRLKQQGAMRQQPKQKWMPLSAEQYYTTNPPAFIWSGMCQMFPHIWIAATDTFSGNHGNMRIKLMSVIPMGNTRGPKMDQGELQRYLGEMVWFPTAWLSDIIEWQAIDAYSVQATIRTQDVTGSVVLHINEQGQLTHVTANRYMGEQGQLTPWLVQCNDYKEVQGMRIPVGVEVIWGLPSGNFNWFRASITEIEYNQSGKVTVF